MARSTGKFCVFLGIAVFALSPFMFGQSLGDLAKQQRAKSSRRPSGAKVYTNDDLRGSEPEAPPVKETEAKADEKDGDTKKVEGAGGTATGVKDRLAKGEEKEGDKQSAAGAKKEEKKEEKKEDPEKTYRDQFAKLRDNLGYEEKKLDVMQRELNLAQTQYYSDPNVALREQTFRAQINQRTEEIKQQQASVENARKSIADLEEELRKKGLPAGWAR